jgi:hypothetical protein
VNQKCHRQQNVLILLPVALAFFRVGHEAVTRHKSKGVFNVCNQSKEQSRCLGFLAANEFC